MLQVRLPYIMDGMKRSVFATFHIALTADDNRNSLGKNDHIEHHRASDHILLVKIDLFFSGNTVAAVDLGPSRHAGADVIHAFAHTELVHIGLTHDKGTGTNKAHIALQHVEELGKLVDAGFSEEAAHAGDVGVRIGKIRSSGFVRSVDLHCAEFINLEKIAVFANTVLAEDNRAFGIELDHDGYQSKERKEQCQRNSGNADVKYPFEKSVNRLCLDPRVIKIKIAYIILTHINHDKSPLKNHKS